MLLCRILVAATALTPPQPSSHGSEGISLKPRRNLMMYTENYADAGLHSASWSLADVTGGGLCNLLSKNICKGCGISSPKTLSLEACTIREIFELIYIYVPQCPIKALHEKYYTVYIKADISYSVYNSVCGSCCCFFVFLLHNWLIMQSRLLIFKSGQYQSIKIKIDQLVYL